jgi:hypothetical protein
LQQDLRRHYASLCRPHTPPRKDMGCSCLEDSSRNNAPLPRVTLVKQPLRRKS